MRALLVTGAIFCCLPIILFRPDVGIYAWAWIGFMNPHRLAWGFARTFPFAEVVAFTLVAGMLLSGRWRFPPITRETLLLALFCLWMQVTTLFALNQEEAWPQWEKVLKIQIMIFVTIMVIRSIKQLRTLIWVIVISMGFYGIKGGIFTLLTGGENRVLGPEGSFIEGNNEIGLALLMTLPLMRYLQLTSQRKWIGLGLLAAMSLSFAAVLGTQSRGALLGSIAVLTFLMLKSKRRLGLAILLIIIVPVGLSVMPQKWFDRMDTIRNYEQDGSAMGRLHSWSFALTMAADRPIVGGGFEAFRPENFARYGYDPNRAADAHSIYFEVLGEHGFVGLFLFLGLWASVWLSCSAVIRNARGDPEVEEMATLARMIQVSLVGYLVSGTFLGLANFDLGYNLLAAVVVAKVVVAARAHERKDSKADAPRLVARRGRIPRAEFGRL